jgi:sugar lactone lactonase YvrE
MTSAHPKSDVTRRLWTIFLFALVLACAAPVDAGKKKAAPARANVNLGDQRSIGHFDISKIVWPNPPAIARIKFEDLYTGQKVDPNLFSKKKKTPKQKWMDRLAGTKQVNDMQVKDLPFQLIRTYGVTADSKGRIYAADQGVGAIFIFGSETSAVELIANGKQAHFGAISGLAIDDNDRLFVTDVGLHRVDVFSPTHQLEVAFGGDVLSVPSSVAIDTENRFLYVVDTQEDVVDVFDADNYKLLRKIGTRGKKHTLTAPGTFSLPTGVAVDADGNVYVTDTLNNRVETFDADGKFINTFGKNGDGPQDFERPKGIAVDCDGHIWVTDAAQDRIKVFNREGRLLIYLGQHGEYPGRFMGINSIAIDKGNRVITSEMFPGRVQVFRYITDAEFDAEKKRREGGGDSRPAAAAQKVVSQQASSMAKDSAEK